VGGPRYEFVSKADTDREDQKRKQQTQSLCWHFLSGAGTELCANYTADHQNQRKNRVDKMICQSVHN